LSETSLAIEKQKERAAVVSVVVKVALTLGKFVAAGVSGSLALFSEAANNLGDVGVTLLSLYAIRMAARPADDDHQFGHGKVESLSALIQTGFLFALAVFILIEAAKRLVWGGADIEPGPFAFGVLIVSIIVDSARWYTLNKIAKATRSAALAADALNFATDIVASALAICGLLAASYGFKQGDAIAAVGVALFVGVAGWRLGRETVGTLIDTAPKGLSEPLRKLIDEVPGVIAVDTLRLRPIGNHVLGEVGIKVARTLSIERVAAIRRSVEDAVTRYQPDVKITVTAEPIALDDESVVERVLFIANRRHVPIHHVTVQALGTRQSISFDAEVDGRMPLGYAHEIVTALETAIADELGADIEVESHIEPMEARELDGRDCDGEIKERVRAALVRRAPESTALFDVHDVRVRETEAGLVVNYHCLVDPGLSVDTVHAHVDTLDRKVRQDCGAIARIVGHAEPVKARDHG
jgi:cation diffusion facilitator family transporter